MYILIFVAELIGVAISCLAISFLVFSYREACSAQRRDMFQYGRYSSRWQIMLELWGIREVK